MTKISKERDALLRQAEEIARGFLKVGDKLHVKRCADTRINGARAARQRLARRFYQHGCRASRWRHDEALTPTYLDAPGR